MKLRPTEICRISLSPIFVISVAKWKFLRRLGHFGYKLEGLCSLKYQFSFKNGNATEKKEKQCARILKYVRDYDILNIDILNINIDGRRKEELYI